MDPNLPPSLDAESPPASSLTGRLANIFVAPGDAFDDIKDRPVATSNWLVPMICLILAGWVSAALIFSQDFSTRQILDIQAKAIQQQVEKGKMTQKQADEAQKAMDKMEGIMTIGAKVMGFVIPPFSAARMVFLWALVLWLLGKAARRRNGTGDTTGVPAALGYMKAAEVAGLAMMIDVLGAVVHTSVVLIKGNIFASPSLILLVDVDPSDPLFTALAALNVMTIWSLGVLSLGLARVVGRTFLWAAGWVFGIWAAYTAASVGLGYLMVQISDMVTRR